MGKEMDPRRARSIGAGKEPIPDLGDWLRDRKQQRVARRRVAGMSHNGGCVHESHVLIVVQNLPVPLDRRVWLKCQALRAHGYTVSVICPKGPGDPARETLDGVHIYKYRPAPAASGLLGYLLEFVY